MSVRSVLFLGCCLSLCSALSGCGSGGGEMPVAPATGKVVFNGEPVNGGSITLSPIAVAKGNAGKPASATIGSDGTFKLSTYSSNDGAVVGKHRVSFSPPPGETKTNPDGHTAQLPGKYDGAVLKTTEVEITSGSNELTIELSR